MRLKNLRDSLEDYEYFALLEQRGGQESLKRIVDSIAPNWREYTRDSQKLLHARRELAKAILAH